MDSDADVEVQICRGFSAKQWAALRDRLVDGDEGAWRTAIEVFERRIRERFLASIDALLKADSGASADVVLVAGAPADGSTLPRDAEAIVVPGFAVVALCCLLIETLQSFREAPERPTAVTGPCLYPQGGCIRPQSSTTDLFQKFLRLPAFGGAFDDDRIAKSFVRGVRNGVMHEAETRGWVLWRNEPLGRLVEPHGRGFALNRTAFYEAVRREFDEYVRGLGNSDDQRQRARFLKKMSDIAVEA
jgi:hypothetical protein